MTSDKSRDSEKPPAVVSEVNPAAVEASAAPEVPAGKARIVVATDFNNPHRVGRTYTVDTAEAELLVREGRARYAR